MFASPVFPQVSTANGIPPLPPLVAPYERPRIWTGDECGTPCCRLGGGDVSGRPSLIGGMCQKRRAKAPDTFNIESRLTLPLPRS